HLYRKKINLFTTDIAASINNILFVRCDQTQFIFTKKATNRRKLFILFLADFNREGEWLLIGKIEADQGMGYFWPHPVGSDDVHASNLIQIKTAAFPAFDIATIGLPVKVADIV